MRQTPRGVRCFHFEEAEDSEAHQGQVQGQGSCRGTRSFLSAQWELLETCCMATTACYRSMELEGLSSSGDWTRGPHTVLHASPFSLETWFSQVAQVGSNLQSPCPCLPEHCVSRCAPPCQACSVSFTLVKIDLKRAENQNTPTVIREIG